MKISVTVLMLLMLNLAFGQIDYTVEKLEAKGYNAHFSPNGNQLLYTSESLKGLILYDIVQKTTKVISDESGAGYQPAIANDEIIFNTKAKNSQIQIYNILTAERTLVDKSPMSKSPKSYVLSQQNSRLSATLLVEVSDDLNNINLVKSNGTKSSIAPLGNRVDYINLSLSPNGNQLLFRVSGRGSFVSDLEGNIVKELGNVEFPKWINDEKVLYTITEDDGYNYLSSLLYTLNITKSSQPKHIKTPLSIALYPDYNSVVNRIVFNTPEGEIFIIHLD